jgi:hypothetical protein
MTDQWIAYRYAYGGSESDFTPVVDREAGIIWLLAEIGEEAWKGFAEGENEREAEDGPFNPDLWAEDPMTVIHAWYADVLSETPEGIIFEDGRDIEVGVVRRQVLTEAMIQEGLR